MMRAAFTVVPDVVYSPIEPAIALFTTKMSEPEIAMPNGVLSPVTKLAFTRAPDVVYSEITSPFVMNKSPPDTAMPKGPGKPVIKSAFTTAPDVVYSPITPLEALATKNYDVKQIPYRIVTKNGGPAEKANGAEVENLKVADFEAKLRADLASVGIDFHEVTDKLLAAGVKSFEDSFSDLMHTISVKREALLKKV